MNTVDHILHKLLFRSTESSSVRDVENTVVGLSMLSVDTSDLDEVFVGDGVELVLVVRELGEFDVYGSSEGSTKVSRARGDITEMVVLGELALFFDGLSGSAESVEDLLDSGSLLHGDDSELILFIYPDKERFSFIVEDTTT